MTDLSFLKGKRIGALDYGLKRVGFAVCDELHVVVSPRSVLDKTSSGFWDLLIDEIRKERLEALVVGVPYRLDEAETEIIKEINVFIANLKNKTGLTVVPYDESFSTIRAGRTLLEIGRKKKKRAEKGSKDKIAAAIILRDFLNENNL